MRRILLSHTLNTRDLGGYPIDRRRATSYQKFLRSDVPHIASKEDIELLSVAQITTIIDLRNDIEVQKKPCAFKEIDSMEYHHCRMHGDGRLPESPAAVPHSYLEMIDEQTSVLKILQAMTNAKGSVLFHCSAGKDRTGVISALLLLLAGVQKPDIIADYHISQAYLSDLLLQYSQSSDSVDINIITPKVEYMEQFLKLFLDKYGSIEAYLLRIGLLEYEINRLKDKLTQTIA